MFASPPQVADNKIVGVWSTGFLFAAINPMAEMPFDQSDEDLSTDAKFAACQKDLMLVGLVASMSAPPHGRGAIRRADGREAHGCFGDRAVARTGT